MRAADLAIVDGALHIAEAVLAQEHVLTAVSRALAVAHDGLVLAQLVEHVAELVAGAGAGLPAPVMQYAHLAFSSSNVVAVLENWRQVQVVAGTRELALR